MAWVLTKGLSAFRDELNAVFPGRDKTTDGSIGDQSHANSSSSGHNPDRTGNAEFKDGDSLDEVRAIDIDRDLVPGSSTDWMLVLIRWLIEGMRAGRWKVVPFRYIIYRPAGSSVTYIWHVNTGWGSRVYTGSNIHDKHAHFSGGWSAAADSRTGLLGIAEIRGAGSGGQGEEMLVKKGDSGQEVKFWQYVLHSLGYGAQVGDIDGEYGAKMDAAVNAYRAKFAGAGSGSAAMITGWQGWHMLAQMMSQYAGKPGTPGQNGRDGAPGVPGKDGAPGRDGKDGRDGVFTGTLNITGGTLSATAPQQGS